MSYPLAFTAVLVVGTAVLAYLYVSYRSLVGLNGNIEKAWRNIDALLEEKQQELGRLAAMLKSDQKCDSGTLEKVVRARAALIAAETVSEKAVAQ